MKKAVELARESADNGEIPVGAVVVEKNRIIGMGRNRQIEDNDPTAHAEVVALRRACRYKKNYRLDGSKLFSTVKPCDMCREAIKRARIVKVIFSTKAAKPASHHPRHEKLNFYSEECKVLMKSFFKEKRNK